MPLRTKIAIRDATVADVEAVEALRQEALSAREAMQYPEDRLIMAETALAGPALVAEVGGEMVGVLSWVVVGDHVVGGLFVIARRRRGQGIAQALMGEHERRIEAAGGIRRAFFVCEERLAPFYESLGFQRMGIAMERLWVV